MNNKELKNKAFTLIELLAVIIILGVLMIIAIPAVTKYINDSRKNGYISSAKGIINGASTLANSEKLGINDQNTTYYIPVEYIDTEKGSKSPYGDFTEAYVGITVEDNGYEYFWISNDETGTGIKKITEKDSLDEKLIESNINDNDIRETVETTGINNREKILILNLDGTWQDERAATRSLNPNGRVEKLDLLNAMFVNGVDFTTKIKHLADGPNISPYDDDAAILYFTRSEIEPTSENKQEDNLVSTEESEVPIYVWFENGTLYWWTEDVMPHVNPNAEGMFYGLTSLKTLDLSDLKTDKTTNMAWMFGRLLSLEELNIKSFDTSKVTLMDHMFYYDLKIENLDVSSFDTSNVTTMKCMFMFCIVLKSLDVSGFNTKNVEDMGWMFTGLYQVESLDLSNFNTSKVTYMGDMFSGMTSIKTLDLSSFDTRNVTDMNRMFLYCIKLESINLSSFNTSNVTNFYAMFDECPSLKTLNVSNFDTRKATDMAWMFSCDLETPGSLTSIIGLENFNTSNVTDMSYMFLNQGSLRTLDLSSFDTSKVKDMTGMFAASNFTTIYVSSNFVTTAVTKSSDMFSRSLRYSTGSNDYVLTGGAGTTFDSSHVDKTYARVDDPSNNKPGYFTLKTN